MTQKKTTNNRTRTKPAAPFRERAKHAWHATPKFVHGAIAGAFVGVIIAAQLGMVNPASALSLNTVKDCDNYAIIKCGVASTTDLQREYKDTDVANVYSHFSITAADIASIGTTAVKGIVYDTGVVKVDDKTVATNVKTASWLSVNGSSRVTENGTTFYVRPLKNSWSHSSGPAYVVMKDGIFQFAIIASCGNPVIGTPVQPPPPTPTPTPTPTPQPVITPPPLTITPTPEATSDLPNAGPGALAVVAAASVIGGFVTHRTHRHLKKRRLTTANRSAVGKRALHGAINHRK